MELNFFAKEAVEEVLATKENQINFLKNRKEAFEKTDTLYQGDWYHPKMIYETSESSLHWGLLSLLKEIVEDEVEKEKVNSAEYELAKSAQLKLNRKGNWKIII